ARRLSYGPNLPDVLGTCAGRELHRGRYGPVTDHRPAAHAMVGAVPAAMASQPHLDRRADGPAEGVWRIARGLLELDEEVVAVVGHLRRFRLPLRFDPPLSRDLPPAHVVAPGRSVHHALARRSAAQSCRGVEGEAVPARV